MFMFQFFNKNSYINVEIDNGIIKLWLDDEKGKKQTEGNISNFKLFE